MKKIIKKIKKTFFLIIIIFIVSYISQNFPELNKIFKQNNTTAYSSSSKKHIYKEAYYQKIWCEKYSGIMEYKNYDKTRVDCLTDEYAVEFDFAEKWAEGVGQALYYHLLTGKKAMLVLILEHPENQMIYYERAKKLGEEYNINVEYMTPDKLNI